MAKGFKCDICNQFYDEYHNLDLGKSQRAWLTNNKRSVDYYICSGCIPAIQKVIDGPKRKVITINTKEKYCGLIKTPFRCRLKRKLMAKPRNEHCNWGLKYPKDICLCFHCEQDRYSNAFYDDWEALNTLAHIARVDGENPTYWDDHNKDNLSMFES